MKYAITKYILCQHETMDTLFQRLSKQLENMSFQDSELKIPK